MTFAESTELTAHAGLPRRQFKHQNTHVKERVHDVPGRTSNIHNLFCEVAKCLDCYL